MCLLKATGVRSLTFERTLHRSLGRQSPLKLLLLRFHLMEHFVQQECTFKLTFILAHLVASTTPTGRPS